MKKMRVLTVVGTRPELIRLARTLACLDQHTEHTLVHTGQNYDYELNEIFFSDLDIRKPDYFLNAAAATAADRLQPILRMPMQTADRGRASCTQRSAATT